MAGGGCGVDAVLDAQRDGGGGAADQARGDVVAHHFEEIQAGMQGLADQQLEGAFGGFEFVALMLQLLDALEQLAARFGVQAFGQAVLLELVEHVAAPGEIAQQDALAVADGLRLHVLVGGRILQHRADVHAAFVREGAVADVRLIVAHRQIGQFGDVARDRGQVLQIVAADGGVAQLQFEIGDDRNQVRVAAAFAVAVDAALDVRAAGFDGRDARWPPRRRRRCACGCRARRRSACELPRPLR